MMHSRKSQLPKKKLKKPGEALEPEIKHKQVVRSIPKFSKVSNKSKQNRPQRES